LLYHINYSLGHLPHKTMKEPLSGEVGDVINTAFAILVKAYPECTQEELIKILLSGISKKNDKWERVIGEYYND